MEFYKKIETALFSDDINTKELIVNWAIDFCKRVNEIDNNFTPKVQQMPSYSSFCKIVAPKDLPRRSDLSTKDGLIALFHSITHIEYSAIDLALDAVYRFPQMPIEFKLDWLIVAQDEVRHFKMLQKLLSSVGAKYGDLPVHSGLFEMAYKTNKSAIDRMAIIPRYFEAGGLDVNPKIANRLINFRKNPIVKEALEALNIIYIEEIEHVKKGDKWFKYLCQKEGSNYIDRFLAITNRYGLKAKAKQFNIKGRKEAGFSCDELKILGAKECY